MGQESGWSLAASSCSGSFLQLQSRYQLGPQSFQGSTGGGPSSQLTHVVVGRIQFLMCCWTEGLRSSMAVDWRPFSVSCHMGLSIEQLTTWHLLHQSKQARRAEKCEQDESHNVFVPISGRFLYLYFPNFVLSLNFCYIVFEF